jgi:hypothetical protein
MKLTIIPIDGAVYKDNYSYSGLDLSFVPSDVHALQWKDTKGWIEFVDNDDGTKPQNQTITELPNWANTCVTKWDEAEAARIAAEQAARIAAEQ